MFLTLLVIGLAGLVAMALPAVGGHGHAHTHAGHAHANTGMPGHGLKLGGLRKLDSLRFLPSPRLVFSVLALYGASGNALVHAAGMSSWMAALVAIAPTALVERLAVTPLWNFAMRSQARPSSPLGALVLEEATAVTRFRNGRGVVSVVRDGRRVQFSASLAGPGSEQARVAVGDRLLVEDVDPDRERLTVSLPGAKRE